MTAGDSDEHPSRPVYRIDDLELDTGRVVVSRAGEPIPLPKLSFDLLVALVESAPAVVSLDELLDRVWAGIVVSPETVSQRVKLLRDALGDDPKAPRYIAGVRGRGYRLIPPAERVAAIAAGTVPPPPGPDLPTDATNTAGWTQGQDVPQPSAPTQRWPRSLPALAVLASLAMATSLWAWRLAREAGEPGPPAVSEPAELPAHSVAVLPFRYIGSGANEEVLAEGVAESILHQLATARGVTVIARTSSFRFGSRPDNAAEIGRALNARYLLEGSVQSGGPRLRVTAQLVDVVTGTQVWSLQFDRTREDVFRIQDEIAREVARALEVSLDGGPGELASRNAPGYDGYLAFLRGRALLSSLRTSDLPAAVEALEAAIALDPDYAAAYVLLARARVALAEFTARPEGYEEVLMTVRDAMALVDKAIEMEPDNGAAYVERGYLKAFTDLAGADADFRRGLDLAPSLARGYEGLAAVLFESMARRRAALGFVEQARRLDPIDPRLAVTHAVYLFYGGADAEGAGRILRTVLDRDPLYVPALARLAELKWAATGELADAASLAEQAISLDPASAYVRRLLVHVYLDLGDEAAARSVLAEAPIPDDVASMLLHAHRAEWREAGELAAALLRSGRVPPVQERVLILALRMRARETGDAVTPIGLIEDWTGVEWNEGQPYFGDSLSMRLDLAGLGDLLRVAGDPTRSRALAEELLRDVDQQVAQFRRPAVWVDEARAIALLLLGRPDDALQVLLRLAREGTTLHDTRAMLETDPVLEPVRADPAFQRAVAAAHEHAGQQRAKLESMRREGLVPPRPAHPPQER